MFAIYASGNAMLSVTLWTFIISLFFLPPGRRLGRPSTPAMRDKPSSPTSPKVESPMTPQLGSAPASLGQQQDMTQSFNNLVIDDRLRIEEVEMCGEADDDMQDGGLGQVVSEPATPVTEDVGLQLVNHTRSNHTPNGNTNHYLIGTEGRFNTSAPAAVEL